MLNILFALAIIIAYIVIHAKKAKVDAIEWAKANKMTVLAAAVVLGLVLFMPKVLTGTLIVVYVLPLVNTWGIISFISNLFTTAEGWVKKLLNN